MVLEISADRKVYLPCEPIVLSVTAKNISDATIFALLPRSDCAKGYIFDVTDTAFNRPSPLTVYGKQIYEKFLHFLTAPPKKEIINGETVTSRKLSFGVSFDRVVVPPGETYTNEFTINRIFDMTSEAKYEIACSFVFLTVWVDPRETIFSTAPPIQVEIRNNKRWVHMSRNRERKSEAP